MRAFRLGEDGSELEGGEEVHLDLSFGHTQEHRLLTVLSHDLQLGDGLPREVLQRIFALDLEVT
jgi:hypothetical protein